MCIVKKRLLPLVLCFFLLVPVFNVSQYEAYAMDLVITPIVANVILTGLVACGVGIASQSDADSIVGQVWKSMDSTLKQSIIGLSTMKQAVEMGVSMWTASVWTDFKNLVDSLFDSSGGAFSVVSVLAGSSVPYSTWSSAPGSSVSIPYVLPGTVFSKFDFEQAMLGLPVSRTFNFGTVPLTLSLSKSWMGISVKSSVSLSANNSVATDNSSLSFNTYEAFCTGVFFRIPFVLMTKGNTFFIEWSDYKSSSLIYPSVVPEYFNDQNGRVCVWTSYTSYLSMMVSATYESVTSVPYVIDSVYYPNATGSVCPDVPFNKVLNLPLVKDIAGVTSADLVGSATYTDVGSVDIPIDVPVVPVVPPVPPIEVPTVPGNALDFSPLFAVKLRNVFPFCIPFDFANLIKGYAATPKEPEFNIDIDNKYLKLHHKIDITPIQFPLRFFRTTAIFLFIWILISKTKDLMKW